MLEIIHYFKNIPTHFHTCIAGVCMIYTFIVDDIYYILDGKKEKLAGLF